MASGAPQSALPAAAATGIPSERVLLAAVATGAVLAPLNSTMIAVALPDIRDEFALSHTAIAWLVSSYLITMAVAQPVAGSLGDRIGRARVLRFALFAFLVASLAATLAPTFEVLVALRIAQAAAGAALIPNGMALLRIFVPEHRLGRINGLYNSVIAVA
ncbi:MAG: MFS transporter, partial [Dehalococcoidia bacterium]|nr:MFS transporter [Dehalococcoidia bacterium]